MYEQVQKYYGETLSHSDDLKTNACCTDESMPDHMKTILANIHDEVMAKYYGCGMVSPQLLKGMKILDLGSGSGKDCYALAQLVGEEGEVVGVDMTDEQLAVANEHIEYHREKFGYKKSNVSFKKGYIEKLDELGLEDNYFDIIISNCVVNLSPDKEAVFKEAYRLLKPGGEMYFSDVYSSRRVEQALVEDEDLYGECLSGALYWNDFLTIAKKCGFNDPRLVKDSLITVENAKLQAKIDHIDFFSATYRLFKIEELETHCEDYGQAVIYKGGMLDSEKIFALDKHHIIERGAVYPVCGNTYRMLQQTRFNEYFEFIGTWDSHYGIYQDCGTSIPFESSASKNDGDGNDSGCC
jgi:ubiquinone/menaquinone biosynthesis C-methylase UbiE